MLTKTRRILTVMAVAGPMLFSAALSGAQEDDDDMLPIRLKIQLPLKPGDGGMTAIDPSSDGSTPRRTSLGWGKTPAGHPIERFSDGSSTELRPECQIETLCDGTKIETLPSGTKIVRWPSGGGIVRNPDGSGAEFKPDPRQPGKSGDLTPIPGTVEVLPNGVVRQTLADENVVLDRNPNGTVRTRPDLARPEPKTEGQPVNKTVNVAPLNPFRANSLDTKNASQKLIPMVKPGIGK